MPHVKLKLSLAELKSRYASNVKKGAIFSLYKKLFDFCGWYFFQDNNNDIRDNFVYLIQIRRHFVDRETPGSSRVYQVV